MEADVEIGFNLVDMAESDSSLATRALEDAEDVFEDIRCRLDRLGALERGHFTALVGELRRQIDVAREQNSP